MSEEEQIQVDIVPYDVITSDAVMNEDTGENHVNIHLWCLDKESKPWLIRVRDFPAYFYIELPSIVNGNAFQWDQSAASKVVDYLNKVMGENAPTNWVFGKFQKLYYYMADKKFPMIFIQFKTLEAVKHCNNLLSKPRQIFPFGTMQLKCYESHIDIIRKFFTARDASFCQWLRVKGKEHSIDDDARISTPGTAEKPIRELSVSYKDVAPISSKESEAWFTNPRILAFDIETYSDNHKAMPDSLNSKHVSNIISCIYYELGNKESRKRYVIVLGDSKEVGDGVTVIRVQNELDLIKEFAKLVNILDPEIISGYNIFAYDYPYLDNRRKHKMMDWPVMGRLQKKPTEMSTMIWKSGAYGTNVINILQMEGRMSIDMLPIVKRDYRLDKYSLEFVSQHFLGRGKLDVKAVDMFRAYERQAFIIKYAKDYILEKTGTRVKNWDIVKTLEGLLESCQDEKETIEKIKFRYTHALDEVTKIVAYCVQDSDLVVDLFDKLNVWIGLNALSSVVGVTIIQLFTRGQQVRCLSQVYDKASRKGVVLDKRLKDKVFYAGGFVFEPKPGLYDGVICLDFASLYPSIMRAMNICFTTLVPPDWYDHIPDEQCNIIDVEQEENPTGMKLKNSEDGEDVIDIDDGSDEDDSEEDEAKAKKYKTYHYKWVKKDVRYGILPEIQDHLVGSRNIIKKELAALEDELEECNDPKRLAEIKLLLVLKDKYSNALKVSANSLYGFLGAQEGGVLSLIEAAMCITATGRNLIMKVNKYVEEKYGASIVYGDTDSSMINLHIDDPKEVFAAGLRLADEISGTPEKKLPDGTIIPAKAGLFPPPLKMEFEKAMRMCVLKKKKYFALLIGKDGEYVRDKNKDGSLGELKVLKRGIIVARRDTCKLVHKTYNKLINCILTREPVKNGFDILFNMLDDLINDRIPARGNLSIIRSVGASYKSDSYFMNVFSQELTRIGSPQAASSRLDYVIVKTKAEEEGKKDEKLGLKMRLIEMYEDSWNINNTEETGNTIKKIDPALIFDHVDDPLKIVESTTAIYPKESIDYSYLISHVLAMPLDQLYSIGFQDILKNISDKGYTPQYSRKKAISIAYPIELINKIFEDYMKAGYTMDQIKTLMPGIREFFYKCFEEI
jgi:DNA polymerase elongation subunit (family B)